MIGAHIQTVRYLILYLFFSHLFYSPAVGNVPIERSYTSVFVDEAIKIDGRMNEAIWKSLEWEGEFKQHSPSNGAPVTQQTEFAICHDKEFIYMLIKAYDNHGDSIVRRLNKRDEIDGDFVAVGLDSYGDKRTAFYFMVNAGGCRKDLIVSGDGEREDVSWDPVWWVKCSVTEDGWIAEMKIPFNQLRFKEGKSIDWGLQVRRKFYRRDEFDDWAYTPADQAGHVRHFGVLRGFESADPGRLVDINPYLQTRLEKEGHMFNKESGKLDKSMIGGIDAKIGLSNNFIMDMSFNPDFGHVEADPSVVNLTAYESYYEEKRPFFVEGNSITGFNIGVGSGGLGSDNLFYSRRIGRRPQISAPDQAIKVPEFTTILGAGKITGRTNGGWSVGIINALTGSEEAINSNNAAQVVEPLTNYFVGRVIKEDKGANTIIGGMLTNTMRKLDDYSSQFLHKSATSGGVNFTHFFKDRKWNLDSYLAFSKVQGDSEALEITQNMPGRYFNRKDALHVSFDSAMTSMTGTSGKIQVGKIGGGNWLFTGILTWKSPGFEVNDMGYVKWVDHIFNVLWGSYRILQPKGRFRTFSISADQYNGMDFGGKILYNGFELSTSFMRDNYWSYTFSLMSDINRRSNDLLRGGPSVRLPGNFRSMMLINSDPRRRTTFDLSAYITNGFNESYFNTMLTAALNYKPTDAILVGLSSTYNHTGDELQYISSTTYPLPERWIMGSIKQDYLSLSLRINMNITPDLTLQYWGQPFVASGKYADYKYINTPDAKQYNDRFILFSGDQLTMNELDDCFLVDEDLDGTADYTFPIADFRINEFISNFVLRWEYRPGSNLFIVWSQSREGFDPEGLFRPGRSIADLAELQPTNVFILKLSYRLSL